MKTVARIRFQRQKYLPGWMPSWYETVLLRKVNVLLPGLAAQPLHPWVGGEEGTGEGGSPRSPSFLHRFSGSICLWLQLETGCGGTRTLRPQCSILLPLLGLFCISWHLFFIFCVFFEGTQPVKPAYGFPFSRWHRTAPFNSPPPPNQPSPQRF